MSLAALSKSWTHRRYPAKQILIHAGDSVSRFYFLKKGYVKVYTISEEGEERILLILKPGDLFPLLKDPNQEGSISLYFYGAMSDVELSLIDQKEFMASLRGDQKSAWELLRYVSEFSSDLTTRLAQLESKKAEDKLESLFSYLIEVCGKPTKVGAYLLELKLTHQDIASLIGLTRETVSVEIKKLAADGKVIPRKGFLLIDKQYAKKPPV